MKMVFQWSFSSLSAISQWALKGLTSLSIIFRQSLKNCYIFGEDHWKIIERSLRDHWKTSENLYKPVKDLHEDRRETIICIKKLTEKLLFSQRSLRDLSSLRGLDQSLRDVDWSLEDLREYVRWSFSDLSKVLLVSQWTFGNLQGPTEISEKFAGKLLFSLSMIFQGFLEPFHIDTIFIMVLETAERSCQFWVSQWSLKGLRYVEWGSYWLVGWYISACSLWAYIGVDPFFLARIRKISKFSARSARKVAL